MGVLIYIRQFSCTFSTLEYFQRLALRNGAVPCSHYIYTPVPALHSRKASGRSSQIVHRLSGRFPESAVFLKKRGALRPRLTDCMNRMLFNATQQESLRVPIVEGQKLIDIYIETAGR